MDISHLPIKTQKQVVTGFFAVACLVFLGLIGTAYATSISDLQQQQNALEAQAQQAQAQAEANKTIAQRAADKIVQVSGQISQLNSDMHTTTSTINSTQSQISDKDQQLLQLQAQEAKITGQRDTVLVDLYETRRVYPDDLVLFSGDSLSKRAQIEDNITVLEKTVSGLLTQAQQAAQAVSDARDQLVQQNQALVVYQQQQEQQQQSLASFQTIQTQLQSNAIATETQLEAQAAQAQAQANQIAQKIQLLTITTNWGSQIISGYNPSWYYTQTGDPTHLGNSSETVANVGCLITSISMVSTFYGHTITPDYMARNASFSSGGSYYWGTPANLGVSLQPSGRVDWSVVQNQIALGHPVIVSIYLPSVGAINSDGSSHYIVIYGQSNGKYLMQDPIGPSNRSYNLSQVPLYDSNERSLDVPGLNVKIRLARKFQLKTTTTAPICRHLTQCERFCREY